MVSKITKRKKKKTLPKVIVSGWGEWFLSMDQAPKIYGTEYKVSYGEVILVSLIVPFHWSSNSKGFTYEQMMQSSEVPWRGSIPVWEECRQSGKKNTKAILE